MLRVELQMLFRFILDPVATAKNSITGTNVYFNSHEWWERHHLKYRQIEKKTKQLWAETLNKDNEWEWHKRLCGFVVLVSKVQLGL